MLSPIIELRDLFERSEFLVTLSQSIGGSGAFVLLSSQVIVSAELFGSEVSESIDSFLIGLGRVRVVSNDSIDVSVEDFKSVGEAVLRLQPFYLLPASGGHLVFL